MQVLTSDNGGFPDLRNSVDVSPRIISEVEGMPFGSPVLLPIPK